MPHLFTMRACTIILLITFLFCKPDLGAQASLTGTLQAAEDSTRLMFASVSLWQDELLIKGTETQLNGTYTFSDIEEGDYVLKATYLGYDEQESDIQIKSNEATRRDLFLIEQSYLLDEIVITECYVPLNIGCTWICTGTITAEETNTHQATIKPREREDRFKNDHRAYFYPNPSPDYIYFYENDEIDRLQLFDNRGVEILSLDVLNDKLFVGHLVAGNYFIRIKSKEQYHTENLIIQ